MTERKGYEVIKFIDRNGRCLRGSDYQEGELLVSYLTNSPQITKEMLYNWLQQIMELLKQYRRCTGQSYYRYVNPYMLMLAESQVIYLINLYAESNRELKEHITGERLAGRFRPPLGHVRREGGFAADVYGFGRSLQYIMAKSKLSTPLTMREERMLLKIIRKSTNLKSSYKDISEIAKDLPTIKTKYQKNNFVVRTILSILAVMIGIYLVCAKRPVSPVAVGAETVGIKSDYDSSQAQADAYLELGRICLGELKDPKRSRNYFAKAAEINTIAADYEKIAAYMADKVSGVSNQQVRQTLMEVEQLLTGEETIGDYLIWLGVHRSLDNTESRQEIIRLGMKLKESSLWQESGSQEQIKREILWLLAKSYEEEGEIAAAAEEYQELRKLETDEEKLEQIYERLVWLYQESGTGEEAMQICLEGIKQLPDTLSLRVDYLKILCSDPHRSKEEIQEVALEYLQEVPCLEETAEYKEFQKEVEKRR